MSECITSFPAQIAPFIPALYHGFLKEGVSCSDMDVGYPQAANLAEAAKYKEMENN